MRNDIYDILEKAYKKDANEVINIFSRYGVNITPGKDIESILRSQGLKDYVNNLIEPVYTKLVKDLKSVLSMKIDDILKAKFGECSGSIRTVFKKTVYVRQYETEVVELESTLNLDNEISGYERAFITAVLQAQLEYTALSNLKEKGQVTLQEYQKRILEIQNEVNEIRDMVEKATGEKMDKYL